MRALETGREYLKYHVFSDLTGLTRTKARIFEERFINFYGMQKEGGRLLNQRHSIAPQNWGKFSITKIKY